MGATIFDTTDEDWHRTFDITLLHGVRLTQLVAPHMKSRGGRIYRQCLVDLRLVAAS